MVLQNTRFSPLRALRAEIHRSAASGQVIATRRSKENAISTLQTKEVLRLPSQVTIQFPPVRGVD